MIDAHEALTHLRAVLREAADTCDRWANESQTGGWSTHQVQANRELANKLRREERIAYAVPGQT